MGLGSLAIYFLLEKYLQHVQNIIWFLPLDLIKFAMKATLIKWLHARHERQAAKEIAAQAEGVPLTRTQSRAASINQSLYSNRTTFIHRAARKVGFGSRVRVKPEELQRFSSIQATQIGATLQRRPSRPAA